VTICAAKNITRTAAPACLALWLLGSAHHAGAQGPARIQRIRADGTEITTNWAGYAVDSTVGSVTDVKGSWIVPPVTCTSSTTRSAFWVGIDGNNNNMATVEQTGTSSFCEGGSPVYFAWYELVPANAVTISLSVQPGDVISAEVSYSSTNGGEFSFTMTDATSGAPPFHATATLSAAQESSAECIAESPLVGGNPQPPAEFGTVLFGSDNTGVAQSCWATVEGQTGPIGSLPGAVPVAMNIDFGQYQLVPSTLSTDGSSFSVTWVENSLGAGFLFSGTDGAEPYAGLVQGVDGNLYGATDVGGSNNGGTAFGFDPNISLPTVLYNFCSMENVNFYCSVGAPISSLTQGTDGNFYGVSPGGGLNNGGTLFEIPGGGPADALYSFILAGSGLGQDWPSGSLPEGALIQASDGNFYGTTYYGGAYNGGTVFQYTPGGSLTTYSLCTTAGCSGGNWPRSGVIEGTDGDLYGTTQFGGSSGVGTIFKMTPAGDFTTLYNFGVSDGQEPFGSLVQGSDGNFYGTTMLGGANLSGTVFKITPKGILTTLYSFCTQSPCTDGGQPWGGLIQGTDGNFYGTTSCCGANDSGTIFKITPTGLLTTLYSLNSASNGATPYGPLLQTTDGTFWGTASSGGTGFGGVFNISVGLGQFLALRPASGEVGASIAILGSNLSSASGVSFNGTSAAFTINSTGTAITAMVPAGATTGPVVVTTPSGTISSSAGFRVTPQITSISPKSGPVATIVTLKGNSFTGATKVTFGGVNAKKFTVNSDTQISATVPPKAKTGKIVVTTAGGTATSKSTFTVN